MHFCSHKHKHQHKHKTQSGYYRDGRYERTFYSMPKPMYSLQKSRTLVGPFWAREFEKAHMSIDDYFQ